MELKDLRDGIDNINDELLELIIRRLELSEEVAEYKDKNNLPIYNKEREDAIINKIREKAGDRADYVIPVFKSILDTSKRLQKDVILRKKGK